MKYKYPLIIQISGPPASGKTTLSCFLAKILKRNGIKCKIINLTGFHNITYIFSMIVLKIITISTPGSWNYLTLLIKRYRRNPYDFIPSRLIKKFLFMILVLEIVSLALKILFIFINFYLRIWNVIIIDEGIINTAFNYVKFYGFRGFNIYKTLLRYLLHLHMKLINNKGTNMILIEIRPPINESLKQWFHRGDLQSFKIGIIHLRAYMVLTPYFLKYFNIIDNKINFISVNNINEGLDYLLNELIKIYGILR